MEQEEFKRLLAAFYEGTTSEEEEELIRKHLEQNPSSDPYLTFLAGAVEEVPEPSERFISEISREALSMVKEDRTRLYSIRWLSAAAAVIIMLATYMVTSYLSSSGPKDTFSDPQLALAEVRSILSTVSAGMQSGMKPLNGMKSINEIPESLNGLGLMKEGMGQNLSGLKYLQQIDRSGDKNEKQKQ